MRTISLLAVVFLSATAFLDSGCSAAAVDSQLVPYKIELGRRTLQRRAPQRAKDGNDDRGKERGKDNGKNGNAKGKERGKNEGDNEEGKGKRDAAKDNNDGAKNAKNAKGKTDSELSGADGAGDNTNNTDNATDGTTGDATDNSTDTDSGDSSLYGNGPSKVAVDNSSTKTAVVGACIGGALLVGAGAVVLKVRQKKNEQTEAIVAKSATAFEQQSSVYEQHESERAVGTFTVVSLFNPTLPDELEIQPGDKVTVLVEYDDGWVQAINESNDGQRGVLPRHCLDMNNEKFAVGKRSSSIGGFTSVNLN